MELIDVPELPADIDSAYRRYLAERNSPVLEMARRIDGAGRARIRAAVVRLAHARGLEDTRRRLMELQAECLAWEASFPDVEREHAS